MYNVAETSLLSRPGESYNTKRGELQVLCEKSAALATMLGQPVPEQVARAQSIMKILAVSYLEGLLLTVYSSKNTKEYYKSKTHSLKKMPKTL